MSCCNCSGCLKLRSLIGELADYVGPDVADRRVLELVRKIVDAGHHVAARNIISATPSVGVCVGMT